MALDSPQEYRWNKSLGQCPSLPLHHLHWTKLSCLEEDRGPLETESSFWPSGIWLSQVIKTFIAQPHNCVAHKMNDLKSHQAEGLSWLNARGESCFCRIGITLWASAWSSPWSWASRNILQRSVCKVSGRIILILYWTSPLTAVFGGLRYKAYSKSREGVVHILKVLEAMQSFITPQCDWNCSRMTAANVCGSACMSPWFMKDWYVDITIIHHSVWPLTFLPILVPAIDLFVGSSCKIAQMCGEQLLYFLVPRHE